MYPNILAGFSLDCNALFINFEKLTTVNYSSFAEVWSQMKFSLVFNGRGTKELSCFTSEALLYAKYFFVQSNSLLRKVCALYLMYGLYYKQPLRNSSKIVLTFEDWLFIKEFLDILKENNHRDAMFILLKLLSDNAFEFAATNRIKYNAIPCKGIINSCLPFITRLETLDVENLMEDLQGSEQDYNNVKREISETLQIPPINYASESISKELKEIFKVNIVRNNASGPSRETENISERRRTIRNKSFRKKNKTNLYVSCTKDDETGDEDN